MKDRRFGRKFFNISKENQETIDKYFRYRDKVLNKSTATAKNEKRTLMKLADFLKEKNLKDATKEDTQEFFAQEEHKLRTKDLYGIHLIQFYRWINDINEKIRPENMKWFEFSTAEQRDKVKDANGKEKYFITRGEYEQLLEGSFDEIGQERALWETMYLSGGRASEIINMKLNDVVEEDGHFTLVLQTSKTIPRKVPLPETAVNLNRWINNHPLKHKEDNPPLWISLSRRNYLTKLDTHNLGHKLDLATKRAGVRKLSPHCFRKTRATIYFSDTVNENGKRYKKYDDSEIGKIFGWKPSTVIQRRQEYDLNGYEDLKNKIFEKSDKVETYDEIKMERDKVISEQKKEINNLAYTVNQLQQTNEDAEMGYKKEVDELKEQVKELTKQFKILSKQS